MDMETSRSEGIHIDKGQHNTWRPNDNDNNLIIAWQNFFKPFGIKAI